MLMGRLLLPCFDGLLHELNCQFAIILFLAVALKILEKVMIIVNDVIDGWTWPNLFLSFLNFH